jgi:hypothetical protein
LTWREACSIRAHARGDRVRWEHAFARALVLFSLTKADVRWSGPRLRELCRVCERFCALLFADARDPSDAEFLSQYFLHYAITARRS